MPCIIWIGDCNHSISVIGSINKWKEPINLIKCRLRQGLYVRYFETLKLGREYEIKFIIDGSF